MEVTEEKEMKDSYRGLRRRGEEREDVGDGV